MEGGDPVHYDLMDDKFHEECGVFGIYLKGAPDESTDAARTTFYGLYALQHRGQESAGIAVAVPGGEISLHKGMGLVSDIFSPEVIEKMPGPIAVGHVRYSTTGASIMANAQPLAFRLLHGMLALAHNGNLVNATALRRQLATMGSIFQTTTDTEVIANLLARYSQDRLEDALAKTMIDIKGAFALVLMTEDRLVGVRDPLGLRPLVLGEYAGGYVLASETCALDTIGATFIRDVEPGEIVAIDEKGITSYNFLKTGKRAHCIFEYIYFARPDSTIDGINVNRARRELGKQLARESGVDADIVIAVPDSGTAAAIGYSQEAGIPFEEGLMKNRYVGRTFIQPTQAMRDLGVRIKLNPVGPAVKGKRVIMVDDSIVRGTQLRETVDLLYRCKAREVHIRSACPPLVFGCKYLNFSTSRSEMDLVARKAIIDLEGKEPDSFEEYCNPVSDKYNCMVERISNRLNFSTLKYQNINDMLDSIGIDKDKICTYCWNGKE
jgi:amidophosphoribosyltransferase